MRLKDKAQEMNGYRYITPEGIQEVINAIVGEEGGTLSQSDHYALLLELAQIVGERSMGLEDTGLCWFVLARGEHTGCIEFVEETDL